MENVARKIKSRGQFYSLLSYGIVPLLDFFIDIFAPTQSGKCKKSGVVKSQLLKDELFEVFFLKHNQRFFANTFHYVEAKHTTPFLIV